MAWWNTLWSLSQPIDAHIGVIEQWESIFVVEWDFWVPFLIDDILELNPSAEIVHIWDIDQHRKIAWNMWVFSDPELKKKTQNQLRELLEKKS